MNQLSLVINLDTQAAALENELHTFLRNYPVGIYLAGRENPVLRPGHYYYSLVRNDKGQMEQKQVTTYEEVVNAVFDGDGNCVIPKHVALARDKFLSTRPTVPVYGRRLIAAYLTDHLARIALYTTNKKPIILPSEYDEVCMPGSIEYDDFRGKVIDHASILRDNMYAFTDSSSWNIYISQRVGNQFTITNEGDWCVAEWERIQAEKEGIAD